MKTNKISIINKETREVPKVYLMWSKIIIFFSIISLLSILFLTPVKRSVKIRIPIITSTPKLQIGTSINHLLTSNSEYSQSVNMLSNNRLSTQEYIRENLISFDIEGFIISGKINIKDLNKPVKIKIVVDNKEKEFQAIIKNINQEDPIKTIVVLDLDFNTYLIFQEIFHFSKSNYKNFFDLECFFENRSLINAIWFD